MQYYDDTADVAQGFGPSAVTIGKFDGVHVGHRAVIAHLERAAREQRARNRRYDDEVPHFAAVTSSLPVAVRPNRSGRYMSSTKACGCT